MSTDFIPFNKPYLIGNEVEYIREAVIRGHISGNGHFTKKCQHFFEQIFTSSKCLLTTSCTDALEMCALLLDIQPGDEVIIPSYTFVSTANAFVLRGAKIVFADCMARVPNINPGTIESLISAKTKAIIVVHYAGIACDMDAILSVADSYNLFVVEDCAQAIDSHYKRKSLGSLGHLSAFSFHETKNIISGEGGMLVINDPRFEKRAEILWEKGTNRAAFFRGEVDKYNWVDIGSSFLPSELVAAFLFAQLEKLNDIQQQRKRIWTRYYEELTKLESDEKIRLPFLPDYATNNGHMFFIVTKNPKTRSELLQHLKQHKILAVFHYLSLHKSPFYKKIHGERPLPHSDHFSDCLVRLPFYYELSEKDQSFVIKKIHDFFANKKF